jgi:hypothetical protein
MFRYWFVIQKEQQPLATGKEHSGHNIRKEGGRFKKSFFA